MKNLFLSFKYPIVIAAFFSVFSIVRAVDGAEGQRDIGKLFKFNLSIGDPKKIFLEKTLLQLDKNPVGNKLLNFLENILSGQKITIEEGKKYSLL